MKNIWSLILFFFLTSCSNTKETEDYQELTLSKINILLFEDRGENSLIIHGGKEPFELMWTQALVMPVIGDFVSGMESAGELVPADPNRLPILDIVGRKIIAMDPYVKDTVFLGTCLLKDSSGQEVFFGVMHPGFT